MDPRTISPRATFYSYVIGRNIVMLRLEKINAITIIVASCSSAMDSIILNSVIVIGIEVDTIIIIRSIS